MKKFEKLYEEIINMRRIVYSIYKLENTKIANKQTFRTFDQMIEYLEKRVDGIVFVISHYDNKSPYRIYKYNGQDQIYELDTNKELMKNVIEHNKDEIEKALKYSKDVQEGRINI